MILNMVSDDDDPRAPYKVYEGGELKGTYATRAEARRANPNRIVVGRSAPYNRHCSTQLARQKSANCELMHCNEADAHYY